MENNTNINSAVNSFIYGIAIKRLTTRNKFKNASIFVDVRDPRFLRVTSSKSESKSRLLIRSTEISSLTCKIKNIQYKVAFFEDELRKRIIKVVYNKDKDYYKMKLGQSALKVMGENCLLDNGELWKIDDTIKNEEFVNQGIKKLTQILNSLNKYIDQESITKYIVTIEGKNNNKISNEKNFLKFLALADENPEQSFLFDMYKEDKVLFTEGSYKKFIKEKDSNFNPKPNKKINKSPTIECLSKYTFSDFAKEILKIDKEVSDKWFDLKLLKDEDLKLYIDKKSEMIANQNPFLNTTIHKKQNSNQKNLKPSENNESTITHKQEYLKCEKKEASKYYKLSNDKSGCEDDGDKKNDNLNSYSKDQESSGIKINSMKVQQRFFEGNVFAANNNSPENNLQNPINENASFNFEDSNRNRVNDSVDASRAQDENLNSAPSNSKNIKHQYAKYNEQLNNNENVHHIQNSHQKYNSPIKSTGNENLIATEKNTDYKNSNVKYNQIRLVDNEDIKEERKLSTYGPTQNLESNRNTYNYNSDNNQDSAFDGSFLSNSFGLGKYFAKVCRSMKISCNCVPTLSNRPRNNSKKQIERARNADQMRKFTDHGISYTNFCQNMSQLTTLELHKPCNKFSYQTLSENSILGQNPDKALEIQKNSMLECFRVFKFRVKSGDNSKGPVISQKSKNQSDTNPLEKQSLTQYNNSTSNKLPLNNYQDIKKLLGIINQYAFKKTAAPLFLILEKSYKLTSIDEEQLVEMLVEAFRSNLFNLDDKINQKLVGLSDLLFKIVIISNKGDIVRKIEETSEKQQNIKDASNNVWPRSGLFSHLCEDTKPYMAKAQGENYNRKIGNYFAIAQIKENEFWSTNFIDEIDPKVHESFYNSEKNINRKNSIENITSGHYKLPNMSKDVQVRSKQKENKEYYKIKNDFVKSQDMRPKDANTSDYLIPSKSLLKNQVKYQSQAIKANGMYDEHEKKFSNTVDYNKKMHIKDNENNSGEIQINEGEKNMLPSSKDPVGLHITNSLKDDNDNFEFESSNSIKEEIESAKLEKSNTFSKIPTIFNNQFDSQSAKLINNTIVESNQGFSYSQARANNSNIMDVEETKKKLDLFKVEHQKKIEQYEVYKQAIKKKHTQVELFDPEDHKCLDDICSIFMFDFGEVDPLLGWVLMEINESYDVVYSNTNNNIKKCFVLRDELNSIHRPQFQMEAIEYKEIKIVFDEQFELFGTNGFFQKNFQQPDFESFDFIDQPKLNRAVYNCLVRSFYWSLGYNVGVRSMKDLYYQNTTVAIELLSIKGFISSSNSKERQKYYLRVFYFDNNKNRYHYTEGINIELTYGYNSFYNKEDNQGLLLLNREIIGNGCLVCLKGCKFDDAVMCCVSGVGVKNFVLTRDDNTQVGKFLINIKAVD